jgi:hypothetical protein
VRACAFSKQQASTVSRRSLLLLLLLLLLILKNLRNQDVLAYRTSLNSANIRAILSDGRTGQAVE